MTYEFVIDGRLKGMNDYTSAQRINRYKGAGMKAREQKKVEVAIMQQLRGVHITSPVRLHYIYYELNRRRDLDNVAGFAHKVIQDALVSTHVLKNDGWGDVVGFTDTFSVDRDNPNIIVMIEEVKMENGLWVGMD